jgi:hypothetical protein
MNRFFCALTIQVKEHFSKVDLQRTFNFLSNLHFN